MKNINKLFFAACAAAALVSCNNKLTYDAKTFISFDDASVTVNEDCGTLAIPVTVYNITKDVTATVKVESSATAGTDYEIVGNAAGVLNFTKEVPTDTLRIKVIEHAGTYTGNYKIAISIASVDEGVVLGSLSSFGVTVLDKDIPVDWDFFKGNWTAQDYTMAGATDGDPYKVSISKVDDTSFLLGNLWGAGELLEGTIEFDTVNNTAAIALKGMQVGYNSKSYGPCWFLWFNGSSISGGAIPGSVSAAGITVGDPANGIGIYVYITSGDYKGYGMGSFYSQLTK